jgi:hypothetical protein
MQKRLRALLGKALHRLGIKPEPVLKLTISGPEALGEFLDDARARRPYRQLSVRVEPWHAIRPDWSGRLGPLKNLKSCTTSFDPTGLRATAQVVVSEPIEGIELVRAAYSLFYPVRPLTGWGGYRFGIIPGAPNDLRWNPGGGIRPVYPRKPPKRRFTDFDVIIDAAGEHRITDPETGPVLLERPLTPAVLIDPKLHRPVERRQPSSKTKSAVASILADRLLIQVDGATIIDSPSGKSLTATDLRQLALVTDIDASRVGGGHAASVRVAELAAYGAIVHDAPKTLDLHPDLSGLVSAPFDRLPLLDHMNRSQHQVRTVMQAHTRAFTSHPLPSVSVILSTVRPDLLGRILDQMAAQDYPNLEVVVGCHGFAAPARESFPQQVQDILGPILEFDRSVIFGEVLAGLSAAASGDFVSKIDDDDWYGPSHIWDLVVAWTYSEAQLVGKKLSLIHFEENDTLVVRRFFLEGYRWQVAGGAAIISRHDLASVGGWRAQIRAVDRGLWTRLEDAGGLLYSCTGPGYVHVRHEEPHTWTVNEDHFRETFVEETVHGIPPAALGIM